MPSRAPVRARPQYAPSVDPSTVARWLTAPLLDVEGSPITPLRVIGLVVVVVAVGAVASFVERSIHDLAARRPQSQATAPLVYTWARILRYAVWVVGSMVGLGLLGFELESLAFVGGAVGVGLGFGLQNVFANFVSGIILLLEGTLKIRDYVELQSGVRGTVREIGLRFTRVQTNDHVDILVPNSEFINSRVTNWTFDDRIRRLHVRFSVPSRADKDRVRQIALRAAGKVEHAILDDQHRPELWLVALGESRMEFELVVWGGPARVDRPEEAQAAVLWALDDELRAEGIDR
jgi:small-conductance mechanosensitive channel